MDSVSYTHLGVLEGNAVVFQVFQGIQAQNAGAFVVGHAAAQQPAIPHAHGVGAVSYTHLDVYKRQQRGSAVRLWGFPVRF